MPSNVARSSTICGVFKLKVMEKRFVVSRVRTAYHTDGSAVMLLGTTKTMAHAQLCLKRPVLRPSFTATNPLTRSRSNCPCSSASKYVSACMQYSERYKKVKFILQYTCSKISDNLPFLFIWRLIGIAKPEPTF